MDITTTITTSPGAAIGHDGETLPAKALIAPPAPAAEADPEVEALLDGIRGLARAVCDRCGLRANYQEVRSPKWGLDVAVQIRLNDESVPPTDADWQCFFARDMAGLKCMRDELIAFVVAHLTTQEVA